MFRGTHGNPYFLEQLIEGVDQKTGQLQAVPLNEIIDRKLQRLPVEAKELLEAIAIAGQAVKLEEAASVSEQSNQAFATITHMRSERLVRLIGSSDQQLVDTYHDKIRETVLDGLAESKRCSLHVRFGELLEREEAITATQIFEYLERDAATSEAAPITPDRIFDLAHHFHMAKDSRALVYQVMAGEQALRTYAIEEAVSFYERAQKLLPKDASRALQYRLFLAMGRVKLWSNASETSIDLYEKAEKAADCSIDRARACAGIGHAYNQIGHFDSSIQHYDRALELIGVTRANTTIGKLFSITRACLALFLIPSNYLYVDVELEQEQALLQHDIFLRLATCMPEKDYISTVEIHLRDCLATLRTGKEHVIAHGYAQAAFMFSGFGAAWIGNILLRRSSRIESRLNDPAIRGTFLFSSGVASYWGGDLDANVVDRSLGKAIGERTMTTAFACAPNVLRLLIACAHTLPVLAEESTTAARPNIMADDKCYAIGRIAGKSNDAVGKLNLCPVLQIKRHGGRFSLIQGKLALPLLAQQLG